MTDQQLASSDRQHRPNRYPAFAALRHRDFRLLWLGQIISVTGSQMQLVAIHWHIYQLTKSPLALGIVGFFRGAPLIVFSLFGGVVADVLDRKRLMIVTQSVMFTSAGMLTVISVRGVDSAWPIYLLTAIASIATAFDLPARQALMPTLVPAKDFPNAVSLGLIVFNVATIAGPALAGLVLASKAQHGFMASMRSHFWQSSLRWFQCEPPGGRSTKVSWFLALASRL